MIIDGKAIAEDILSSLGAQITAPLSLGVVMGEGDAATESFVRIKSRVAERLGVSVVREVLPSSATTEDAVGAVSRLTQTTQGIIVQLPLPPQIDSDAVLRAVPASHDIDAVNPEGNHLVRGPVAEAVLEILKRTHVSTADKKAVMVGAGRLVGAPAARALQDEGAHVVVLTEGDSLSELKDADIVVLGAGNPGMIMPDMLKPGVVLIDAGTSEAHGKLQGDADPACAEVASVFTPVPGGVGPITVAMIFKNLLTLAR